MLSDLAKIDSPFRLVVDSVDFFLEVMEPHELTTVARQIRHRCQTIGGHALLAAHSIAHERSVFSLLQDLADLVVELKAEPKLDHYEHTLSLEKVGNRPGPHPHLERGTRRERLARLGTDGPTAIATYPPVS